MEGAGLRGDISQGLEAVYANPNPDAYPISAYSYLVTQCAAGDRPNCLGRNSRPGKIKTLDEWMATWPARASTRWPGGQGYAPLPPQLSQEIANAHRLTGEPAER